MLTLVTRLGVPGCKVRSEHAPPLESSDSACAIEVSDSGAIITGRLRRKEWILNLRSKSKCVANGLLVPVVPVDPISLCVGYVSACTAIRNKLAQKLAVGLPPASGHYVSRHFECMAPSVCRPRVLVNRRIRIFWKIARTVCGKLQAFGVCRRGYEGPPRGLFTKVHVAQARRCGYYEHIACLRSEWCGESHLAVGFRGGTLVLLRDRGDKRGRGRVTRPHHNPGLQPAISASVGCVAASPASGAPECRIVHEIDDCLAVVTRSDRDGVLASRTAWIIRPKTSSIDPRSFLHTTGMTLEREKRSERPTRWNSRKADQNVA
jgi:hypothetical protein